MRFWLLALLAAALAVSATASAQDFAGPEVSGRVKQTARVKKDGSFVVKEATVACPSAGPDCGVSTRNLVLPTAAPVGEFGYDLTADSKESVEGKLNKRGRRLLKRDGTLRIEFQVLMFRADYESEIIFRVKLR
jgi:hypothetical protein